MNNYPVKHDEDRAPESISDTDDLYNCNGDLDHPDNSKQECTADDESDIQHKNGIQPRECPEHQTVSAVLNDSRLIRPTRKSTRLAEMVWVTVNIVETRRNKAGKKK
jgi:hypothetical protein